MGNVQDSQAQNPADQTPPERPPKPNAMSPGNPTYPSLTDTDHDYEILRPGAYPSVPTGPGAPIRPAPKPPATVVHQNSTHTLGAPFQIGLEGVPFIVNPKFLTVSNSDRFQFPKIKARTMQQLLKDYDYPFTVERQT